MQIILTWRDAAGRRRLQQGIWPCTADAVLHAISVLGARAVSARACS